MVVDLNGSLADSAWSYPVGKVKPETKRLLDVTKESLYKGIEQVKVGNRIGDIGHAIQTYVEAQGFSVVRNFIGHGIGPTIHEKPEVPHFGLPGKGPRIKEGMVFTIEPMVNTGGFETKMDNNGWTARTRDGSLSAQYEHTIAVTSDGIVVITEQK
jgi:methionyl aminopeptidase